MRPTLLAASMLLMACAPPAAIPGPISEGDKAAIRSASQAMVEAGITDEVLKMGRFFTEDAVWMPAEQPVVQGRAAIEAWFTVRATQWDVQILEVEGVGDLAFTREAYTLMLDLPDFVQQTGHSLTVWRRQPDGAWLVARESFACDAACG